MDVSSIDTTNYSEMMRIQKKSEDPKVDGDFKETMGKVGGSGGGGPTEETQASSDSTYAEELAELYAEEEEELEIYLKKMFTKAQSKKIDLQNTQSGIPNSVKEIASELGINLESSINSRKLSSSSGKIQQMSQYSFNQNYNQTNVHMQLQS